MFARPQSCVCLLAVAAFAAIPTPPTHAQPTAANPIDPADSIDVILYTVELPSTIIDDKSQTAASFTGSPATFNDSISRTEEGQTTQADVHAIVTTSAPTADLIGAMFGSANGVIDKWIEGATPLDIGAKGGITWSASLAGTVGYAFIGNVTPEWAGTFGGAGVSLTGGNQTFNGGGSLFFYRGTVTDFVFVDGFATTPIADGTTEFGGEWAATSSDFLAFWKLFKLPPPGSGGPNDLDKDGKVDGFDASVLQAAIHGGVFDPDFDYNNNQVIDEQDFIIFLSVTGSSFGDANFDGNVDAADLGIIDQNWEQPGLWSDGDFNWDLFVDVDDYRILLDHCQSAADGCFPRRRREQRRPGHRRRSDLDPTELRQRRSGRRLTVGRRQR